MYRTVEAVIYALMSEAVDPGLELLETQNKFVSEHLRRIFVQIYRIVGNVADAQDLTQEAFIKALQRQEQLKDGQKAAHWLSRIATNTAIDFLRRSGRVSYCELDVAPPPRAWTARHQCRARSRCTAPGDSGLQTNDPQSCPERRLPLATDRRARS
jgi:RNA polymerase sigma factor (sigma-70 family)